MKKMGRGGYLFTGSYDKKKEPQGGGYDPLYPLVINTQLRIISGEQQNDGWFFFFFLLQNKVHPYTIGRVYYELCVWVCVFFFFYYKLETKRRDRLAPPMGCVSRLRPRCRFRRRNRSYSPLHRGQTIN